MQRRRNLLMMSCISSGKSQNKYGNPKTYKGRTSYLKQVLGTPKYDKTSPKYDLKIVQCVQQKPKTQEPTNFKIVETKNRSLSQKFKGKNNTFMKNRKRSVKRGFKERSELMVQNQIIHDIPPKTEGQNQIDSEWLKSVSNDLTEHEKSVLLSINDQSERNKEYSEIMGSKKSSSITNREHLAGQPLRQSKITLRNLRSNKRFDEMHFEKVSSLNAPEKRQKLDVTQEEATQNGTKDYQLVSGLSEKVIECIKHVRSKGIAAKERRSTSSQRIVKRTPPKMECQNTHGEEKLSKMTPIPFPSLSPALDNTLDAVENSSEHIICEQIEPARVSPVKNYVSTQDTNKQYEVIEKVQGQTKDVSVPLITEIQPKEVAFKNLDTLPDMSQHDLSNPSPAPTNSESINREVVQEVKDTNKGLKRTPAKLTNRVIYSSPLKMELQSNAGSEFKTPLPKRTRSVSASRTPPSGQKNIVNTFSMRKYEEVQAKDYDEILLPKTFQLVLDFFTELDNAINNCKRRGKCAILSNLKPYIEMSTSRSFALVNFQKVLYCAPDLFYYTWQPVGKAGEHEIRIEIPENIEEILTNIEKKATVVNLVKLPFTETMTNFVLNKRKKIIRARLMQYTKVIHSQFLKNINKADFDFIKNRGWHPDFNPEGGLGIPAKKLEDVPKLRKLETVGEFMKNNNIKNNIQKRVNDAASHSSVGGLPSTFSTSASSIMLHSAKRSPAKIINEAKISPNLYKRIETKSKMYEYEKRNMLDNSQRDSVKRKQELMLKIAQAVKSVFSLQGKVNTLFLNNVLKHLNDSQRGKFYEKKELIQTLKDISEIVPEWLTLKKHDRGFLVKI